MEADPEVSGRQDRALRQRPGAGPHDVPDHGQSRRGVARRDGAAQRPPPPPLRRRSTPEGASEGGGAILSDGAPTARRSATRAGRPPPTLAPLRPNAKTPSRTCSWQRPARARSMVNGTTWMFDDGAGRLRRTRQDKDRRLPRTTLEGPRPLFCGHSDGGADDLR